MKKKTTRPKTTTTPAALRREVRDARGNFPLPKTYAATVRKILAEHTARQPDGRKTKLQRKLILTLDPRTPSSTNPPLSLFFSGSDNCNAGLLNYASFNRAREADPGGTLWIQPDTPESVPPTGYDIEFICRAERSVPFITVDYPDHPLCRDPRIDHDPRTGIIITHAHMHRMSPDTPCDGPGLSLMTDCPRGEDFPIPPWKFLQARIYALQSDTTP